MRGIQVSGFSRKYTTLNLPQGCNSEERVEKTLMESEGSNCESSKRGSTRGEDFENHVKVKDRKDENTEKVETTRDISCQTDFDDILHQRLEQFEDEIQLDELEKEFIEEKSNLEIKLRNEYNEIIKAKDELIRVLTEEKDFFWSELRDLRKSFDLFTRHVHRDALQHLSQSGCEKELGTKRRITGIGACGVEGKNGCHDNTILDCGELLTVLRKQEEVLLRSFERQKAEMTQRFEREELAVRKLVEEECQARYAYERAYLLHSIDGLKEGLDSLRIQKDELAKIFEGEKNALELSYKRKEDELRQNLKLELQRKIIHAQKPWTQTKI